LKPGSRYLINAGAVGQPRDGDPRACLVLLDPAGQSVEFVRVAYDIEDTQRRMRALGYPEALVVRLKAGR
jgi:diadenosine tetraphosphatase ApaH/serine/threonine PP2A family protein phosphatase